MKKQLQSSDMHVNFLHHGRSLSLPVYLLNHMEAALLALAQSAISGKALTLRKHFGKEIWEAISDDQPSLAGICVAYLVSNRRVPFVSKGIDPESKHQLYASI